MAGGREWEVWAKPKARSKEDELSARRLENACWRAWNMEKKNSSYVSQQLAGSSDDASGSEKNDWCSNTDLTERLRSAIGNCIDFATCRFQANPEHVRYDDLPTFPVRPNFAGFKNSLRPASECVVFDGCPEDPYHPSNTPIYQTATFVQPSCSEFGAYDYTRSGNPTRTALEKHVALLEQAAAAFAFASGMAALHTVMRLFKSGDEVLVNEDIYGGMHRLLTQDCVHAGISVKFVDTTDLAAVERAITPRTKMLHTESPSNPRMRISDLKQLAVICHQHHMLLSVDSTMMPPVICKPLTLGADIVVHSATKFFSGHADCTGGLVCLRSPEIAHRVAFLQNCEGTALAPFECFLFLRGIKTMHLRVERAQENAALVAAFLLADPRIKACYFPGRGGCSSKDLVLHKSQALGQGSMISLSTGCVEFSKKFCDACKIFKTTVSFGSVNSLCEMPCTMSHASIPAEERTLPADLVRLSIGIEDARDLIADLAQALDVAAANGDTMRTAGFDSVFEDLPVLPDPQLTSPALQPQAPPMQLPGAPKGRSKEARPSVSRPQINGTHMNGTRHHREETQLQKDTSPVFFWATCAIIAAAVAVHRCRATAA